MTIIEFVLFIIKSEANHTSMGSEFIRITNGNQTEFLSFSKGTKIEVSKSQELQTMQYKNSTSLSVTNDLLSVGLALQKCLKWGADVTVKNACRVLCVIRLGCGVGVAMMNSLDLIFLVVD